MTPSCRACRIDVRDREAGDLMMVAESRGKPISRDRAWHMQGGLVRLRRRNLRLSQALCCFRADQPPTQSETLISKRKQRSGTNECRNSVLLGVGKLERVSDERALRRRLRLRLRMPWLAVGREKCKMGLNGRRGSAGTECLVTW